MRRLTSIFIVLAIIASTLGAAAGMRRDAHDAAARHNLAEYYTMRGAALAVNDSAELAYHLVKQAYDLCPDDEDIAVHFALMDRNVLGAVDKERLLYDYGLIKRYFDKHPDDYLIGEITADLTRYFDYRDDAVEIWHKLSQRYPQRTEISQNLVQAYLRKYLYDKDTLSYNLAMQMLDTLQRGSQNDLGIVSHKIMAYMLKNDTVSVMHELDSLTVNNPDDINARMYAGSVYHSINRDTMAIEAYNKAADIDPADGRPFISLANIYNERGDSVMYDRLVFQALESSNLDFEPKYDIMRAYVSELMNDTLQWPRIEHLFSVLDSVNPGESGVHVLFGAFENTRGNHNAAREQFEYAASLDPMNTKIQTSLMSLDLLTENFDKAISHGRVAAELFPDNFVFPIMTAQAYMSLSLPDSAIHTLQNVHVDEVRNPQAVASLLSNLAEIYSRIDNRDSAVAIYDRVIKLDPDNFMAYNNAAYFMALDTANLDKARQYGRFAVLAEPHNPTFLDTYAWVLHVSGDTAEAKEYINRAMSEMGVSVRFVDKENNERFIPPRDADGFDVVEPDNVQSDDDFNDIDINEVEEIVDETNATIVDHAADIYLASGDTEGAIALLQYLLSAGEDNKDIEEKLRKIEAGLSNRHAKNSNNQTHTTK